MIRYTLTAPAESSAGVHVLAADGRISDADFRRTVADGFEKRFRQQVGPLRPEIMKASVDTIREATMRRGTAHGAGVAIDVAKRVAGVDLV